MRDTFTGYVPKVGDRVKISAIDYAGEPGFYAGYVGTIVGVAPSMSNCFVNLDSPKRRADFPLGGDPGIRFFPGEVEPLTVNAADVAALSQ